MMMLFTHCYRDSVCVSATSMRPICDLHDCSQIKMPFGNRTPFLYKIWWTGGSDHCLMPVFFIHTFQRENTYANCMKMHHLKWRITKIFWGGALSSPQTPPPPGRGIPPPRIPPRRLDARAFHGQLPRMSSDPRNAPDLKWGLSPE